MRNKNLKRLALTASVSAVVWFGASASAATLQDIFELSAEGTRVAQASQTRVEALSDEAQALLADYRSEIRTIEDLRAYNIQKEKEIADQRSQINKLTSSIERATMIDRQILPLISNMIETLEIFVNSDKPFKLEERLDAINFLKDNLDDSNISTSEKFRLAFEAYQAENNYGREMGFQDGNITLNNVSLSGKLLNVGRVALFFQTVDQSITAHWNPASGDWEELDSSYTSGVATALKIAEGQIAPDLVRLPLVKTGGE
ncbi:MAG: DUF3450 domain-containing protein [Sphingomonadales bacterium]